MEDKKDFWSGTLDVISGIWTTTSNNKTAQNVAGSNNAMIQGLVKFALIIGSIMVVFKIIK